MQLDIVSPITDGMTTILSDVGDVISAVAPGAVAIVGAILAVRLGIRLFRSLITS